VTTATKGAAGEEPTGTPTEKAASNEPAASPAGDEAGTAREAGASTPRRRRGTRGGRRHKRATPAGEGAAAVAGASPPAASPAAGPGKPEGGGAGEALPTAPLIPVGSVSRGAPSSTAPPAVPAVPVAAGDEGRAGGRDKDSARRARRPRSRSRSRATTAEAPAAERAAGEPARAGEVAEDAPPAKVPESARPAKPVKKAPPAKTAQPQSVAGDVPAAEPRKVAEGAGAPDVAAGGPGGEEPAAKRRRRGSRGGRRRRKDAEVQHEEVTREAEEAAGEPAKGDEATEAAPGAGSVPEPEAGREGDETATRRRRGGRKGRSRREPGEIGAVTPPPAADDARAAPEKPESGAKTAPKTAGEAKPRRRDPRRPKAIVRQDEGSGLNVGAPIELGQRRSNVVAEKPDRKIILVTDDGEELRVALVEDGRLAEIYIERPDRKSYLGDIYQGKVENVMNGIDAAFVDFGLEKNGFLYVDEVTTPEGEKRARRIGDALKNGQQVLVQVTKDPMGHKGARLSTKISLAGRYLVYVPGGSGVGVSRRLRQSERERLRDISKELKPKDAGLIVRTIAEGHGLEDLKRDLRYLSRLWSRLKKKAETVKAPGLVHKEVDVSLEVTRDLFNDTCESLIVDDAKRHKAILSFLDKEAPELLPKVRLHTGTEPLFEAYGIDEQIAKALERRVPLPSGGNLVIDHAEALTVIDVNTGRFTRGKGLEDTITKTNLEAAREVVRQLRLRDIGGILIIDFIDMAHAKNREMVLETLEAELETDRTKTYVVELSPLGLVEMTRQNTTDGARGILTRACPTCAGKARVLSEETMALNVERKVRALARKSQAKAWLIEVNGGVAERLSGARLKRLEKQIGRRVFLEGASALPVESYRVIAEGGVTHVEEQRVPVREGQEVTVELEFSLTYSPRDAVGYIDGYMVIVEGGRQHLGKRRKVRITETARTGARAVVKKQAAN